MKKLIIFFLFLTINISLFAQDKMSVPPFDSTTTKNLISKNLNNNFIYSPSYIQSGMTVTYNASNFFISAGSAIINGDLFTLAIPDTNGVKANYNLSIADSSLKDPFVFYENGTYYMFYTLFSNAKGTDSATVGYATSTNLTSWTKHGQLFPRTLVPTWTHIWAPTLIKDGSYYYMFVCIANKMAYLKSSSLTSGWTYQGILKNNNDVELTGLDPKITYYEGEYYLTFSDFTNIYLYKSSNISSNSWIYQNIILTKSHNESIVEAPALLNTNPFILYYGVNGSNSHQRISIAISNIIDGTYQRKGNEGLVLLDFPNDSLGSISHPTLFYNSNDNKWYLFACTGTIADGNNNQKIVGYKSSDCFNWEALSETKSSYPANKYIYIYIRNNKIYYALDKPETTVYTYNNAGYLYLGYLTTNGSGTIATFTSATNYGLQTANGILLNSTNMYATNINYPTPQQFFSFYSNDVNYFGASGAMGSSFRGANKEIYFTGIEYLFRHINNFASIDTSGNIYSEKSTGKIGFRSGNYLGFTGLYMNNNKPIYYQNTSGSSGEVINMYSNDNLYITNFTTDGDLIFRTNGTSHTRMIIDLAGNVTVGTNALNTSGTPGNFYAGKVVAHDSILVNSTKLIVPDYVFNSSYKSYSIYQMRDFYKENKHLPTMSSAEDIKEKGEINLVDYSMKLLETIENQAKYIVQIQNSIDAMKKDIKKLKEKK
jgi:hypothetical protein